MVAVTIRVDAQPGRCALPKSIAAVIRNGRLALRSFWLREHLQVHHSAKFSRSTKGPVPIFPDCFKSTSAKDCCDFGRGTLVTDLELPGGELIFSGLVFGRYHPTAYSAMQMFTALPSEPPGSVWLPALIIVTPIKASESRSDPRSRVLSTMPSCGKVIRNAQTS